MNAAGRHQAQADALAHLHQVRSTERGALRAHGDRSELEATSEAREAGERSLGGGAVVCTRERFPLYSPCAVAQAAGVCKPEADATSQGNRFPLVSGASEREREGAEAFQSQTWPRVQTIAQQSFAEGDTLSKWTGGF